MELDLYIFNLPNQLASRFYPVFFEKNLSLIDKFEQSYFSKGFM